MTRSYYSSSRYSFFWAHTLGKIHENGLERSTLYLSNTNALSFNDWTELNTLHKKRSFLLRISLVNVTKSAGKCGFGHIYWRNLSWKTFFFFAVKVLRTHSCIWRSYRRKASEDEGESFRPTPSWVGFN